MYPGGLRTTGFAISARTCTHRPTSKQPNFVEYRMPLKMRDGEQATLRDDKHICTSFGKLAKPQRIKRSNHMTLLPLLALRRSLSATKPAKQSYDRSVCQRESHNIRAWAWAGHIWVSRAPKSFSKPPGLTTEAQQNAFVSRTEGRPQASACDQKHGLLPS